MQEMGQSQVDILRRETLVRVRPCAKTKGTVVCHVSPCDTGRFTMTHLRHANPNSRYQGRSKREHSSRRYGRDMLSILKGLIELDLHRAGHAYIEVQQSLVLIQPKSDGPPGKAQH